MSLLDTSYLSPTEANDDTPMPSRDRCSSSAIPIPPDWTTRPARAGQRVTRGEGGVEPQAGHGDAEAVRADQAHAVPAADRQQVGPGRRPGPAVITTSERTPRRPQLRGHVGDRGGGHREDGQVHRLGQVRDRRQAVQALHRLGPRVDRVDRPGEAAGHDVVQDFPADRPAPPAGADHGHRLRLQQVPQAGHVGAALAGGHRSR